MKQIALFSLILTLVVSLAAPTGAAFAMDSSEGDTPSESAPLSTEGEPLTELSPAAVESPKDEVSLDVEANAELPLVIEPEIAPVPPLDPPVVVPPVIELPVSPIIITAYKASGAHIHAVQLYNNSSQMVSLDGVSLLYLAGDDEYEVPLVSGWIEPRSYVIIAWQGESLFADMEFGFTQVGEGVLRSVTLRHQGYSPHIVSVPAEYRGDLLHRYKSAAGNYTTNTTFAVGAETISGGGFYALPEEPDVSVLEILVNPRSCVYGAETPDCYDYIKLRNNGAEPLDLTLYRLRSGFSNTNSSATNTTYFTDILKPGEVRTLTHDAEGERVSFSANDGTVWLEDRYGYQSYDLYVPPYVGSSLAAQTGRSWAYNSKTNQWQWATPAPGSEENDFTVIEAGKGESQPRGLVPCRDDQYRSEETNRCRSITVPSSLQPCREGQYRSEETNRCRSIATAAAAVLKPCADGQFRSPETNRCRKIASADDVALADCGEGRERNPATNRCRNAVVAGALTETLPFAVESTEASAEYFAGWWTLGAVAFVGAAYGVWEWRQELTEVSRRAVRFITRGK